MGTGWPMAAVVCVTRRVPAVCVGTQLWASMSEEVSVRVA